MYITKMVSKGSLRSQWTDITVRKGQTEGEVVTEIKRIYAKVFQDQDDKIKGGNLPAKCFEALLRSRLGEQLSLIISHSHG